MDTPPVPTASLLDHLRDLYENRIPFNRTLGMTVTALAPGTAKVRFAIRPELIGNPVHQTLHGGVISAVLDATGGLTASTGLVERQAGGSLDDFAALVTRVGTIDLRVDYLRPGRGETFTASGTVMRAGNKVAVIRMELHDETSVLLAVGTGTYLVG
ncbi:MAG: thioesterase family protein [Desulfobacterales bacterium]|nr:thioesterase family protein [Desulfobacterales bacterium]